MHPKQHCTNKVRCLLKDNTMLQKAALVYCADDMLGGLQAKVQELEKLSSEQAAQVSTLREELQGSLAELDQV